MEVDSPLIYDLVINAHYCDDPNYLIIHDARDAHFVRDAPFVRDAHDARYFHDVLNVHLFDDHLNDPLNYYHATWVILHDFLTYFHAIRYVIRFYFNSPNHVLNDDLHDLAINVIHDYLIDAHYVNHDVMVILDDRIDLLNFLQDHDVNHYVIHYASDYFIHYFIHDAPYFILNADLNYVLYALLDFLNFHDFTILGQYFLIHDVINDHSHAINYGPLNCHVTYFLAPTNFNDFPNYAHSIQQVIYVHYHFILFH